MDREWNENGEEESTLLKPKHKLEVYYNRDIVWRCSPLRMSDALTLCSGVIVVGHRNGWEEELIHRECDGYKNRQSGNYV